MEQEKGEKEEDLAKRFGINLVELKKEQLKLSKNLILKDSIDFSQATSFAAIENMTIGNRIISAVILCDKDFNIIEQQYFTDKLRFPYIHEFRSYREMPSMAEAINKLSQKPDLILVHGHGICHPRLGLASHLSLLTGIPVIGVANALFEENKISKNGEDILSGEKKVGKVLQSKEKSNPIYVSPGSSISINSAYEVVKNFIKPPHKLPEPLHLAHKYARSVRDEIGLK